jgi:hypothetical protein
MIQPRPMTHLLMLQSSPMEVPAPIAMDDPRCALREDDVWLSRYLFNNSTWQEALTAGWQLFNNSNHNRM